MVGTDEAARYTRACRYAEAHCNLGVIHKEEGRLEDAIASYERALALAAEFAIVRNNLAIALTEMGTRVKLAGAPGVCQRASDRNPCSEHRRPHAVHGSQVS